MGRTMGGTITPSPPPSPSSGGVGGRSVGKMNDGEFVVLLGLNDGD